MSTAPFQRKGRFWRGNLHTHSTRSDGRLPPEAVADFYKGAGYDFLALTDHFWEHCGYPITDTRPLRTKSFTTLIGAEIHAPLTAKGHDWHIVALGLPFDYAPPGEGETMQGHVSAGGGGRRLPRHRPSAMVRADRRGCAVDPEAHAVEIYNHGCAVESGRGDGWVVHDEALARGPARRLCGGRCAFRHARCRRRLGDGQGGGAGAGAVARGAQAGRLLFGPGPRDPRCRGARRGGGRRLLAGLLDRGGRCRRRHALRPRAGPDPGRPCRSIASARTAISASPSPTTRAARPGRPHLALTARSLAP